jgi:hypothetical protein
MCHDLYYPPVWLTLAFKLGLNIPIRQGQTRYQYLVMQFSREEEITAELNMSECVSTSFTPFPY